MIFAKSIHRGTGRSSLSPVGTDLRKRAYRDTSLKGHRLVGPGPYSDGSRWLSSSEGACLEQKGHGPAAASARPEVSRHGHPGARGPQRNVQGVAVHIMATTGDEHERAEALRALIRARQAALYLLKDLAHLDLAQITV